MAAKNITVERLRALLEYEPDTGVLRWRRRAADTFEPTAAWTAERHSASWNSRWAGKVAGSTRGDGYVVLCVDCVDLLAHRVIWAMLKGAWPAGDVDHKDGDPGNNRERNLRDGSTSFNIQNQRAPHSDNDSGYLGVSRERRRGYFVANIYVNGKNKYLGSFDDPLEAHKEYLKAKRQHHEGCTI